MFFNLSTLVKFKLLQIALIIFYGSLVKGVDQALNIDVAIFCKNKISTKTLMEIEKELEKLPILRNVEVVDLARVEGINIEKFQRTFECFEKTYKKFESKIFPKA